MQPAGPNPAGPTPVGPDITGPHVEVGDFAQGTPFSRWALARYLVGRVIASSVSNYLLVLFVVVVGLAVLVQWTLHATVLTVLLALVAAGVWVTRLVVRALIGRLTAADRYGPVEQQLRALVADTQGDVKRELRRLGLPSRAGTVPLLAVRLIGRRRRQTVDRLREFDINRVAPDSRIDALHMVLRTGTSR